MPRLTTALLSVLSVAAITAADTATAQSLFTRDRNVSVLQRSRPEYDPTGYHAGQFIIRPKIDVMAGYSDNVFALSEDAAIGVVDGRTLSKEGDGYFIFRPSLVLESDWQRNALITGAYAESTQHIDFDDNNVTNYGVFADGRLDIARKFYFLTGGSYDLLHESRKTTNEVTLPSEPVEYAMGTAYAGLQQELGRVRYRARLSMRDYDYEDAISFIDGSEIDQDYRDRQEVTTVLQGGFAVTRDASVFLRGTYTDRSYDNLSPSGLDRDATGYSVETGIDFDISRLTRGSVALGYMQEDYDDPALDSVDGLSVDAGLEYFPSQRVTMRLNATRAFRASALVNSSSYIASDVMAGIDIELLPNFILTGSAGYGMSDYENDVREEERYGASLGAIWLINRYLRTQLTYTHENQDVDTAATTPDIRDYEINEVLLKLTVER